MNAASQQSSADPYRIVNLDHEFALPGGVGQPWDKAIVLSTTETARNPWTGKDEPKRLWPEHGVGTLEGAHAFVHALSEPKRYE